MLYAVSRLSNSYASAYIHQAAWKHNVNREELIYIRIAGKPTFVKAMASGLMREQYIISTIDRKEKYLYGSDELRCLYFRIGKMGIATIYNKKLFNHSSAETYIIGEDKDFIRKTFLAILKRKPIIMHEKWDPVKILTALQLITTLETYNISGFEVFWDTDKINNYMSYLVKIGELKF